MFCSSNLHWPLLAKWFSNTWLLPLLADILLWHFSLLTIFCINGNQGFSVSDVVTAILIIYSTDLTGKKPSSGSLSWHVPIIFWDFIFLPSNDRMSQVYLVLSLPSPEFRHFSKEHSSLQYLEVNTWVLGVLTAIAVLRLWALSEHSWEIKHYTYNIKVMKD